MKSGKKINIADTVRILALVYAIAAMQYYNDKIYLIAYGAAEIATFFYKRHIIKTEVDAEISIEEIMHANDMGYQNMLRGEKGKGFWQI